MRTPVLVDSLRTPIGKRGGGLSARHCAEVLGHVQTTLLERSAIAPESIGQLVGGCVTQIGEQSFNVTRMAWLHAGLPESVAGSTLDCQCGSSQQATHLIRDMIAAGTIDAGIACGVELMSRIPIGSNASRASSPKPADFPHDLPSQFVAAERIATHFSITREDADAYGLASQRRAREAADAGRLAAEIAPIEPIAEDEGLRETSLEALSKLQPTVEGGIHTAGTTSQISDGAAAALWMEESVARARGLRPRARIRAHVLVGTDPYFHLLGPVDATRALLDQTGITIDDIDVFEINEAFAAVVLAWQHSFEVELDRLNVNGGAIALGHPLGATGARLIGTAVAELERRDGQLALVAMCCGGAVATGTIIERL